nr:subtilisin-like protease SBT4.14 [Tanacetum cinerariifolium]
MCIEHGLFHENYYIVLLGDQAAKKDSKANTNVGIVSALKGSELDEKALHVYSYTISFNAFAAKLTPLEARELSGMDRLPQTARRKKFASDIIVGVMDTGITPQSDSFNDDGFGPPPAKWKGSCHHSAIFSGCNNKLIGGKYFNLDGNLDPNDILSP